MPAAAAFGLGGGGTTGGNGGDNIDSSTPWLAIADGNLSLLQSSLQALNLPITAADENGYTLLQAAASYSHMPILEWLMEQQQEQQPHVEKVTLLNAVDLEGDTALHYASTREAAEFLVHHGIDVNIRNDEGRTALENKQEEIHETLMENEGDDDDGDGDGDGNNDNEKEEDEELVGLREIVAFLSSLDKLAQ